MTKQEREELLELLTWAHGEGDHDEVADEECPICIEAAAEAARLIRIHQNPTAGRKSKKPTVDLTPEQRQIVEDWKGGTTIAQINKRTGMKRSAIRTLLENGLGGKDAFKEFRQQGGGGARRRTASRSARVAARTDLPPDHFEVEDIGVPRITSSKLRDGWKYRTMKVGYDGDGHAIYEPVHTAPDGTDYVMAAPGERADLIRDFPEHSPASGLEPARLRKLTMSTAAAEAERHAEAERAIAAAKPARRARRKGAAA